jgi:hypothetical protein
MAELITILLVILGVNLGAVIAVGSIIKDIKKGG